MTVLRLAFPFLTSLPRAVADLGLSLDSELDAMEFSGLQVLIPVLVQHLEANDHQRLGSLVVDLAIRGDAAVAPFVHQSRSRSALARAGVTRWRDLAKLSPNDLRRIPGVGAQTVRDILGCCVERAVGGVSFYQHEWRLASRLEATETAVEALQLLGAWGSREGQMLQLKELLQLTVPIETLPSDLRDLWNDFSRINPRSLAGEGLAGTLLEELIEELLGGLDDAEKMVYERRVLRVTVYYTPTLEELGQVLGVTREWVRQVQANAEDAIQSLLASQRFRPLLWRAADLRASLGTAAPLGGEESAAVLDRCLRDVSPDSCLLVRGVLLHLAGPYRYRDGWLELSISPDLAATALVAMADTYGLLPLAAAYDWLTAEGVRPAFHDAWLERSGRFRRIGSTLVVWSGSVVDKSVAILALRGKPADAETLVAEIGEGHSPRTAQNGFLADPRLVRVGRSEWGLRSWNLEEYSGITDEIAQRIQAAGGRTRLDDVADELVRQFGVRRASVRVYAEAPMFVVEDGWVRLRGDEEPFEIEEHIASCKGVYQPSQDRLSIIVLVDRETVRGSSRVFPAGAAAILNVAPGRPRTFVWDGGEIGVTWPASAAFGPTLGSTRALALSVGAQEGDHVRLDFNLSSGRVSCERIPPAVNELPLLEALKFLTGVDCDDDPVGKVALALHTSSSEVRRRLFERGDSLVAELLPIAVLDGGLESALSELAQLLERQD
jgi:sigma-70-like protein